MAGAGEMAQNLRTLVALTEEPGLFPASVLFPSSQLCVTPVLRDLIHLLLWAPGMHIVKGGNESKLS